MVHVAESTVGRRYASWFIKNTERAQRIYDELRNLPLPSPVKQGNAGQAGADQNKRAGGQKVTFAKAV
jgi:translation initiation factor 3 subunit L